MSKTETKQVQEYMNMKKAEPILVEKVQLGLQLHSEISELSAELEDIKGWMRDFADGEKFDFTIPGAGSVQVKTPSEATFGTTVKFDEKAFNLLPKATRQLLINTGVVSVENWYRAGSKAAVQFTPNK